MTGAAAWNRLFDETIAALRFDFEGESLTLEPLLGKLMDPDERKRETAANALAAMLGANLSAVRARREYARQGQGDFRPLAQVRRTSRIPADLANRVEREVVDALVAAVTDAYHASGTAPRAESALVRQGRNLRIGIATRRCPARRRGSIPGKMRATPCSTPITCFSPRMADIARLLLRRELDRRAGSGPARFLGPSRIRRRPPRTLTCSSIISASRAT